MKRQELKYQNRVDIDLLTHEKQEAPLELDDDTLEFRFCSKCEGNYEYCMDHLYTHEHVKRIIPSGTDVK